MNDKHKKLIEDAAKKHWEEYFQEPFDEVDTHDESDVYQSFFQGMEYILDNLQLFGLVERELIDKMVKRMCMCYLQTTEEKCVVCHVYENYPRTKKGFL